MNEIRFNEAQAINNHWEKSFFNNENIDNSWRINKIQEEVRELSEALNNLDNGDNFQNRRMVAEEAMDLIILAMQIIHESGFDCERIFKEKMDYIYRKYAPVKAAELRQVGLNNEEIVKKLKIIWNEGNR